MHTNTPAPRLTSVVASMALGLSAWMPAASFAEDNLYQPIQSISLELGSKFMSGYFLQESGTCAVTLMIAEKGDPDAVPSVSPTRLRLLLQPGEIAGLDSEEGISVNLTCARDAATLGVDRGDRDRLVAQQALSLKKGVARVWAP